MNTKKRLCQLSYSLDSKKTVLQPQPPISSVRTIAKYSKISMHPLFPSLCIFH